MEMTIRVKLDMPLYVVVTTGCVLSRLLATQIARLKIKQEAMELWELSGKGEISYL